MVQTRAVQERKGRPWKERASGEQVSRRMNKTEANPFSFLGSMQFPD